MSDYSDDDLRNRYAGRGRLDSLGDDDDYDHRIYDEDNDADGDNNKFDEVDAYQPRDRDTFKLRRGAAAAASTADQNGNDPGNNYQDIVVENRGATSPYQRSGFGAKQRRASLSSDGDGEGYGRKWSEATSGQGGDFLYGHGGSSEVAGHKISSNTDTSPLKNSLLTEKDEVYLSNNKDLVEQIATEKESSKRQEKYKRRMYQVIVFLLCYTLNFFNRLREQFVNIWKGCSLTQTPDSKQALYCNDFQYSIMISSGIGFIFLGNIYDNIEKPRQVTTLLLVIISTITLIEAFFSDEFNESDSDQINVSFTLFQMSSLFEAGITLVCIVIIHNWFKEEILGTITAMWFSSTYLQTIVQETIYINIDNSDQSMVVQTIRIESFCLFGCYLTLAVICWFLFWHHPSHIGIKIRESHDNPNGFGFVVDNTSSLWNPTATQISTQRGGRRNINSTIVAQTTQQSMVQDTHRRTFNVDDDLVPPENRSHDNTDLAKMDVTLIDAFKIKEINLLIASYIFAMCHNLYVLKSDRYIGVQIDQRWFSFGAIVGVLVSGALVDLVFKQRCFLTIFVFNGFITAFDFVLYFHVRSDMLQISDVTVFFLGAVQSSLNIVYLFLLPMLIAKQHSEEMASMGEFQRISYAGTIVGVVIALCAVGKYLFSDNLASLLDYWTNQMEWHGWRDFFTSSLQLISMLIIAGPIRKDWNESHILRSFSQKCCGCGKRANSRGASDETETANGFKEDAYNNN